MSDNENTIEKLQTVIEVEQRSRFTDSDILILHKMIELWKAFEVLGRVANISRNVVIWIAGFILLWFTPLDQIGKIVKKMIGME